MAFMRAFSAADSHRIDFAHFGWLALFLSPALFCVAVAIVRRFAPGAAGSGIPQTIYVIRHGEECPSSIQAMTSPLTLAVKVVSILLGVWAGASAGREGPTVQIAMCMMFLCMGLFEKFLPIKPDPRSLALSGGAAGLAAAFNTPLAGVTFALEELSGRYFENIKDYALMAIIVAALSAKVLTGNYIYFGKLPDPPELHITAIIVVSIVAGVAGHLFSLAMLAGTRIVARYSNRRYFWLFPAFCALAVIGLAWLSGPAINGPGNGAAQKYLQQEASGSPFLFSASKFLATAITYCSGVAGGIFAPSLAIGSGIGAGIAGLLQYPAGACALVGMSAFLCGAILAPMTSFVIIFELTGHHSMILPIMLASLIAYMTAKMLGAKSLYATLADRYEKPL